MRQTQSGPETAAHLAKSANAPRATGWRNPAADKERETHQALRIGGQPRRGFRAVRRPPPLRCRVAKIRGPSSFQAAPIAPQPDQAPRCATASSGPDAAPHATQSAYQGCARQNPTPPAATDVRPHWAAPPPAAFPPTTPSPARCATRAARPTCFVRQIAGTYRPLPSASRPHGCAPAIRRQ